MLHITEDQVLRNLPMSKAIDLVEEAFRQLADGSALNHPRRRLILPGGSILHYMAAATPRYFGIKVYSTNPKTGAHFEFLLYRAADGEPLARIEANRLGQIRTGAASAVATNILARRDAEVLGIIGSGFQAETQLSALAQVRNFNEVRVWSRDERRRSEFALNVAASTGLKLRAADSAQEALREADVVVTATNSKAPVVDSAWIAPGTHINAMGSNWDNRRELPADLVFDRADLVTIDSVEDGKIESGDLLLAVSERPGTPFPAVDLGEILTGRRPGRTSPDQITVFKSNGLAVQDVAVAGWLYEQLS
jgi:ornithine cyclodeaminase/alanine dehydrogenase-like protein (mu-crystallin family)